MPSFLRRCNSTTTQESNFCSNGHRAIAMGVPAVSHTFGTLKLNSWSGTLDLQHSMLDIQHSSRDKLRYATCEKLQRTIAIHNI